ncbi:MAG TPA: phytoene desaturase family protein [Chitinivibrionales bacterium]|nr:phytoene desaturase family protein [Chitinivibrionales bacterium]
MNKKKIVIVGAGPGGLTAGMILQHRGFDVTIYEKAEKVGGRNAPIEINGYTFDTGPTFLMMYFILQEMFEETGRKAEDYIKVHKLDPMYRLKFFENEIRVTDDHDKMEMEIAREFPGEEKRFKEYLKNEEKRLKYLFPCLQKPYSSIFDMMKNPLLKAIPHLDIDKSVYNAISKYFQRENLKFTFMFQSKYLGMSAWECPAAFAMVAFIEHKWGIYHVIGGLNKISTAMAKVFIEEGGTLKLNTPVKSLVNKNKLVQGVQLSDGTVITADEVIVNADFSYAAVSLMEEKYVKKYAPRKLSKRKYSCSTFMLYLGVKKKYNFPHHNVFFAKDYRRNVEDIFTRLTLSDQISFYIQNASIVDHTLAPEGKSTIYILVPVANLKAGIDWNKEKDAFKKRVLEEVVKRTEMKDLLENIEVEKVYTPETWRDDLNVYYGATFNLGHNLTQMLYLRPRNRFECFENTYLVGGGTHPGSGLPTIYESGRISANMICEKHGVHFKKPSSLEDKLGNPEKE